MRSNVVVDGIEYVPKSSLRRPVFVITKDAFGASRDEFIEALESLTNAELVKLAQAVHGRLYDRIKGGR
jgi:hypothetical protein